MTIALYITRLLALRLLLALFALSALLELFDLFNNARELLARGGHLLDLFTYAALRYPAILENALPIAMLVATLMTLLSLARANEWTALRSAGFTVYRILALAIPVALVSGILHFVLIDIVTPWSERRFITWWNGFEKRQAANTPATAVWLRSADSIMRVGGIGGGGESFSALKIVRLSESGSVVGWLDAEGASRTREGWALQGVRRTTIDGGRIVAVAEADQPWPSTLDPTSIVELASPTLSVSTARMRRILEGTWAGDNSPSYYRTQLHHSYALPLSSFIMLLLAAPAAYGVRRQGGMGRGLALGFSLGMAYLLTDGVLSAFGEARVLPPLVAAWSAPLLFALIGGSVLLQYEE